MGNSGFSTVLVSRGVPSAMSVVNLNVSSVVVLTANLATSRSVGVSSAVCPPFCTLKPLTRSATCCQPVPTAKANVIRALVGSRNSPGNSSEVFCTALVP